MFGQAHRGGEGGGMTTKEEAMACWADIDRQRWSVVLAEKNIRICAWILYKVAILAAWGLRLRGVKH